MKQFVIIIALFVFVQSCKKQQDSVCSLPSTIVIASTQSQPCIGTATISIQQPSANTFQYSIGNNTFQSSAIFNNVKPGIYDVVIKDGSICSATKTVTVNVVAGGPLFTNVMTVLKNNCASCHSGINPQAGHDFLNPCIVLQQWDRINARAVNGNPATMPPTGLITVAERNKITEWINAGHGFDN